LEKVSDLRKASKQYYKEIEQKRFPPSYYLAEGETKRVGDIFEKIIKLRNSRILTAYSPEMQLQILGFEDKDFHDHLIDKDLSFENTITVLVPGKSLILINVVVDGNDADEVKTQLKKCNNLMKAVYAANHKYISNQHVTIVGTIIFPSISAEQLQTTNFPFFNFSGTGKPNLNFLCKEQVDSYEGLNVWWNEICKEYFNQPQDNQSHQAICDVAGEMIYVHNFFISTKGYRGCW